MRKNEDDKYIRTHISLDPKLFKKLKEAIIKSGRNRSDIVRDALRDYLTNKSQ